MNNWSKERGHASFTSDFRSQSPSGYTNKHTTRFSKPVRKQEMVVEPMPLTHEALDSANATDDKVPVNEGELLQFLQQYQKDRDAEVVKKNDELKTSKLLRTENVPHEILQHRRSLPIFAVKDELIKVIKNHQFVIVEGATGSGKSSQIPQYIAEAGLVGDGLMIGITQPRRVAAKSLAERVAIEAGVKLGTSVGFVVRFESCVSSKTVIKYMTDGILVKDCVQSEPNLDSYSVVIIDEAHDRSIHTDVCLGLLKRIARDRPDLKIIISSATLDVEKFSRFFDGAPVFTVDGKCFEVEVIYEPSLNYMDSVTGSILKIHYATTGGDILVFLTGQDEIETIYESLDQHATTRKKVASELQMIVIPCYGTLSFDDQQKMFLPTPKGSRKVVLATNIAETSITIDGIVFVIDCGYVKERCYNHSTKIETLNRVPISKFQAIQRQGRAGRTQPGKCYRLYTEESYMRFRDATLPDIQRSNVDFVILDLLAMGLSPLKFEFVDPPPGSAIGEALLSLKELSALDDALTITDLGRQMCAYPLDPPLAKVLITSAELGCSKQILKIVSLLSTQHQHLFMRNKWNRDAIIAKKQRFHAPEGDHLTLLKICDEWINNNYSQEWCAENFIQFRYLAEAEDIKAQLQDIMIRNRLLTKKADDIFTCKPHQLNENICKAFTAGYFFQLAKRRANTFTYEKLSSSGERKSVWLHPSSALFKKQPLPEWLIFHEVMETSKAFMVGAVETKQHWIKEYSPEFYAKIQRKYPEFFV